jgi:ribosome modulation factor
MLHLLIALSLADTPVHIVSRSRAWAGCAPTSAHCDGYLLATLDMMARSHEICPDRSVTAREAWALVDRFRRGNPEARDDSFPQLAQRAFAAAFPCPAPAPDSH